MMLRKILGALLIILIGLPVLFGMIWAVGLVKASVSSEFLTELPREIIAALPDKADEIFKAAQDETIISDPATRAWFQAAAKTGFSPRDLMDKTGLLAWMRGGLSDSLRQVGEVLRGETPLRSISISLRPLKDALLHPEMDRFLEETLKNLPPCDDKGLKAWQDFATWGETHRKLPPCVPDLAVAKAALLSERTRAVRNLDDHVEIFEDVRPFPFHRFGFTRVVTLLSYLLFLLPTLIIFLGSLLGTSSRAGLLRWSGVSVLAGSLPALLLALGIKHFSLWALEGGLFTWRSHWATEFGEMVLDKLRWIPIRIVDQLFSPVVGVAAVVAVVGVVLVALSYSVRQNVGAAKS